MRHPNRFRAAAGRIAAAAVLLAAAACATNIDTTAPTAPTAEDTAPAAPEPTRPADTTPATAQARTRDTAPATTAAAGEPRAQPEESEEPDSPAEPADDETQTDEDGAADDNSESENEGAPEQEPVPDDNGDTGEADTEPETADEDSTEDDEPATEIDRVHGLLDALTVAAETSGGYDRDLFRHWVDADGNGCDARREVLIAEAVVAPSVGSRCSLSGGEWLSRYDGKTTSGNGSSFDVDHMVPLAEAWESGARNWTADRREDYANDLGFADSLIAVSASSNRSKGARDPAEWLPPTQGVHCWYTAAWVQVKTRWNLTIDQAETDKIRSVLAGCDDDDLGNLPEAQTVAEGTTPAKTEAEPEPVNDCHPAYEPCLPNRAGDALNCGDLTSDQKPVRIKEIGVDPYRFDRDNDGWGCTS